ncbi:NACHT domain-containing protein [bacterium]|nr:MAG: NACHT domain-containing protein [bacterium]
MLNKLSHEAKKQRLAALDEDHFRDEVVRPLFSLQGLRAYRDVCGVDEEGKDCILLKDAEFGITQVYVIQTKTGKLNMTRKATENVETAITQLRTAMNTKVALLSPPRIQKPDVVYLCCSGGANTAARKHIFDELGDNRIRVMDVDDIIGFLDTHYPTYWLNISHFKRCYLEAFRQRLFDLSDAVFLSTAQGTSALQPFAEGAYVEQRLFRVTTHMTVKHGEVRSAPKFEEIEDSKLLNSGHPLIFVTGEGGTGKTTLLRRMAKLICDASLAATDPSECILPVLIRSQDLIHETDLVEHIHKLFLKLTGNDETTLEHADLEAGRVVVLIDAVDELGSGTGVDHAISLIEKFHKSHEKCQVIVTTRPLMAVRTYCAGSGAPLFEIADFSIAQAARITRRMALGESTGFAAMTEALRRAKDVHGMKLSPLLVTVFAATPNFQTSDIPPNLTAIFKKFAALMLGQWDRQKGGSQHYEWDLKHRILSSIALKWHSIKKSESSLKEFSSDVKGILDAIGHGERVDDLTDELLRSGLLLIDSENVSFRHHLFQEYFAGTAIESVYDVESVVDEEWWRNAIVFSFGARPNRGDELSVLIERARSLDGAERYRAVVSIGLALQACFMTGIDQRSELLSEVLGLLSGTFKDLLNAPAGTFEYPVNEFLFHFLESRSCVSSDLILKTPRPNVKSDEVDCMEFLRLAGAIETGLIARVKDEVIAFEPSDLRLLLGLHAVSFFVQQLKVSTSEERTAAMAILEHLSPKVAPLINEVFQEFKGMVLELQQGKVRVLNAPVAIPKGHIELLG